MWRDGFASDAHNGYTYASGRPAGHVHDHICWRHTWDPSANERICRLRASLSVNCLSLALFLLSFLFHFIVRSLPCRSYPTGCPDSHSSLTLRSLFARSLARRVQDKTVEPASPAVLVVGSYWGGIFRVIGVVALYAVGLNIGFVRHLSAVCELVACVHCTLGICSCVLTDAHSLSRSSSPCVFVDLAAHVRIGAECRAPPALHDGLHHQHGHDDRAQLNDGACTRVLLRACCCVLRCGLCVLGVLNVPMCTHRCSWAGSPTTCAAGAA